MSDYYVKLRESIEPLWPHDLIDLDVSLLDKVWITPAEIQHNEEGKYYIKTDLLLEADVTLRIPGIDGLSITIGGTGLDTKIGLSVNLFPDVELFLGPVGIYVNIASNILLPAERDLDNETGTVPKFKPKADQRLSIEIADISCSVDLSGNIDFELGGNIVLPPTMIGDTGIVIEAGKFLPVFSESSMNLLPGSIPRNWRGIYLDDARIYLPSDISVAVPTDIQLDDFFIGSGGFCGKITGQWTPQLNADRTAFTGNGAGDIFGIPFAFKEIAIELKQNTFVESKIEGSMILPFFDQPVSCEVRLTNDGDFTVALSADQTLPPGVTAPRPTDDGLFVFTKEDLLELKLKSIQFKKEADLFSIQLGGDIKPLFGGLDWPEFEVKALTIDSKGHVSIDGGWIEIPKQKSLDFHGFKLELTKIGFGREADGARWIGLSGGINIVEGIPFKGGVDGLKIIWTDINNIRLQISGINVAFEISDVLKFDGIIFFIDEPNKKGFKGGVKMIIYPLGGMMLDAQFMAGRNTLTPPYNFFYIYIGVELPVGIPLGQTGVSLYGMAGLFGYNVLPNKGLSPCVGEGWFENDDGSAGYYKRGTPGITSVDKWTDSRDSLALGAGITLGTADNGFTFSGKVLLVVLIPGPMILVEGKAQFLRERKGLDEDPIFRLLAVLDAKAGTFLMNIDANYVYPPGSGLLVDISGSAEAYFNFNNPNAWHLYLGQETPEAKRILAPILSLYYAEAFFMMDAAGVRLGVRAGYNANWKFGPLRVVLQALVEGALGLSTKPTQAYGSLALIGNVELKAFGKGIGLSLYTGIAAQAPTPWFVRGEFSVKLKLPWPLPDPEATIVLEWKEETEPPIPVVLSKIGIEHLKVTEKWELDKYPVYDRDNDGFMDGQDGEPGTVWQSSPIIPLDARPVLTFSRPVDDRPRVGDNPSGVPSAENVGEYQYKYCLKGVTLHKMAKTDSAAWVMVAEKSEESTGGTKPLYGHWQVVPGEDQQNVKLMLWANTPFDISRELESNESWLYGVLDRWGGYPCNIDTEPKRIAVDFEELVIGSRYSPALLHDDFLFFTDTNSMMIVEYHAPWLNTEHGFTLGKAPDNTPKFKTFCLEIKDMDPAEKQTEITRKEVVFKCATLSDGKPSYLSVMDFFPSSRDGRNEIYVSDSSSNADSARYATINFREDKFPQAPHQVTIDCGHSGELTLEAYDGTGKRISEAQHTIGMNRLQQLVLTGKDIRRIDIIGREISICELCYEVAITKTEQNELWVVVPEPLAELRLYLSKGSQGEITLFTESGESLYKRDFNIPGGTPDNMMEPLLLEIPEGRDPINAMRISGSFTLLRLSCLTEAERNRIDQNVRISGHVKTSTVEHWARHEGAYLEPNQYYKLTVVTETERISNAGSSSVYKFNEHTYFQTANPPGAYDRTPPQEVTSQPSNEYGAIEHYPRGGLLKDLSPYILYTIPAQVASNEKQRPAYRSYDIGVKFSEAQGYVETMYLMADLPLRVRLYDNNDQEVLDSTAQPIELLNNWGDNPEVLLTREEEQWRSVLTESSCNITDIDLVENKDLHSDTLYTLYTGSRQLCLKPQTLYKAKLYGGDYPVYEFSFITSHYCTFIHHIHSFADALWDHHKLLGTPADPLLNDAGKDMLQNILSSSDIDEPIKFEQISNLFELGIRQLPEQVEILLLNDDERSYGLLLESPEPLDWERIELSVKYSSTAEAIEEFTGNIKIIGANIGAQSEDDADYNTEWVDILLIEQSNVSGLKIQHKKLGDSDFFEYFEFKDEDLLPAGTVIRIHSGKESAHEHPEIEIEHRYRLAEVDEGAWQFDPTGEVIRIIDGNEKILNWRSIIPYEDGDKETIIVRSKDETRAFIFFPFENLAYSNLLAGRYRLRFEFKRYISDEKPALKRMGLGNDEEAHIEFSLPSFLP